MINVPHRFSDFTTLKQKGFITQSKATSSKKGTAGLRKILCRSSLVTQTSPFDQLENFVAELTFSLHNALFLTELNFSFLLVNRPIGILESTPCSEIHRCFKKKKTYRHKDSFKAFKGLLGSCLNTETRREK